MGVLGANFAREFDNYFSTLSSLQVKWTMHGQKLSKSPELLGLDYSPGCTDERLACLGDLLSSQNAATCLIRT